MEHVIVKFKVKKNESENAKTIIADFVAMIKVNEPGTVHYSCYQEKSDGASFIHMMAFKDEPSEEIHRHTEYVRDFVEKLYPICEQEPEFSELNLICTI